MDRKPAHDWYLREWLDALNVRFHHAWMQKYVGYSDGKASNVLTGKKRYDKDIVNEVSEALNIQPFELLMHPDLANAIRAMRRQAPKLAADADAAETNQVADELRRRLRR